MPRRWHQSLAALMHVNNYFHQETHQEQVENTTYWWPLARCYASTSSHSPPGLQKLWNNKQHQLSH